MVNDKAQADVQKILDGVTSDKNTGVPGLVFAAIDAKGQPLVQVASGKRGKTHNEPMTLDTVFWIASCTKILATIACLQAVERGILKLDDHQQVYKLCPELEKVQVLQADGTLVPKTSDITLRMLLSHTAGFGYEFFDPKLRDHGRPVGYDVFHADVGDILRMPLCNQPGSAWEYGINIDWAGIVLERATGVRLNDWLQKEVMQPLGIKNVTMFPSAEMKKNLAYMHQRWPGSQESEERDHIYREPLLAETDADKERLFHSGGAGCFAKPVEYVQILAALLNGGKSPATGAQILKPETVKSMFENQIPQFPDYARGGVPAAKSEQSNPIPELYPQAGNPPQGWGLSGMLTIEPGPTGRGKSTLWWAGKCFPGRDRVVERIANLFYWVDADKQVAGIIASNIMPFGDPHVMGAWGAAEAAVYAALK